MRPEEAGDELGHAKSEGSRCDPDHNTGYESGARPCRRWRRCRGLEHVSILRHMWPGRGSDQVTKVLQQPVSVQKQRSGELQQVRDERPECAAAVTDGVLVGRRQLGHGSGIAVRDEYRVVAEAVCPSWLVAQPPANLALFDDDAATGQGHGGGTYESGSAPVVGHVGELAEHKVEVGRVVAVPSRPTGQRGRPACR